MLDTSVLPTLLSPDQVSTTDVDRNHHARDWGTAERDASQPDVVVWPESTAEVAAILEAAVDENVPVTPYAAGTGIEGNAVPSHGGISLDLTRMDAIDDVRPTDRQIDVEPGVIGAAVDDAIAAHGLFFPPLPTSAETATIGGMIATNASGKRTVKYGKVADWVREIEVALADGSVLTTGTRAVKSSSGYNLRDLIVGSEGTLGVVTRATLELAGRPDQTRIGRVVFEDIDDATAAVADIIRSGVDVAAVELIDALSARMVNEYIGSTLPDRPMVFLEFHANHDIGTEVEFCRTILDAHEPLTVDIGNGATSGDVWKARRELADAIRAYYPDRSSLHAGDVAVPVSSYPELIDHIHDVAAEYDVPIPLFGHAGDGNAHFDILIDTDDDSQVALASEAYDAVVTRALELDGTATGEHGIGQGKRRFMRPEHGHTGVRTMSAVKKALDPTGILNPGKILPDD